MASFIDQLPVDFEVKRKLLTLGARSPEALLSMSQAAPEAFDAFLGPGVAAEVRQAARTMAPAARFADADLTPARYLGARTDSGPGLRPPPFDIEKRDRIFEELQSLKLSTDADPARIADLERQLEDLFAQNAR